MEVKPVMLTSLRLEWTVPVKHLTKKPGAAALSLTRYPKLSEANLSKHTERCLLFYTIWLILKLKPRSLEIVFTGQKQQDNHHEKQPQKKASNTALAAAEGRKAFLFNSKVQHLCKF